MCQVENKCRIGDTGAWWSPTREDSAQTASSGRLTLPWNGLAWGGYTRAVFVFSNIPPGTRIGVRFLPFIWLAYLVVPIEGWGLFHGRPLGGLGALALAALCWLWWVRRSLPFAPLAIVALAAKIALGATLLTPRGFDARYYANAEFAGAPEADTEPCDRAFTRTDARLRFGGPEDADLPVYFLNDSSRFNFYLPNQPDRSTLPVSVIWEGWLRITRAGMQRMYVRTAGAHVVMTAGDDFSATISPSTTEWVGYANLNAGFQRIRISLSIPQGVARRFEAGRTVDGREEPFDTGVMFRRSNTATGIAADWLLRAISTAFDLMVCGWLVVGVLRALGAAWRRITILPAAADALTIASAAAVVDAILFAGPILHKMVTLSGGNDWLTYETMARDIGLHGLWMAGGAALGHGHAFYFQPLYPYFVAATHWLFGGDLYGVYFVQRLLTAGTVIALWRLTAALFGEPVGSAGLLAGIVVAYEKVGPWSGVMLSELLFLPLVCVWALLLVRLAKTEQPSLWSAGAAGAVGGLATLTRSPLMLGSALALPLVALSLARTKRAGRIVVVLAVTLMAFTSLATVRNWVVAREFVLVSSSGSINLVIGNEPPRPVVVPAWRRATYERFGFDPNVQTVVEYARQLPRAFLDGWRRKAAYTLGSFATLAPEAGRSAFYMGLSLIAAIGVLLLTARPSWLRGAGPASLIPMSLALAHFAVLVVIFPTVYGDRLLLPFYGLLVPYVGIAAFGAHRAFWRLAGPMTGVVMWLALFGLCAWRLVGGAPEIDVPVVTIAVLVWGLCVYGVPRLPASAAAVYGTLAIGLCIWSAVRGTAGVEQAVRLDGLFLAAAVCSRVMVDGVSTLRVPERPMLAWLAACITALTLAALHVSAASATVMTLSGLAVGAAGSLLGPSAGTRRVPS